jgi:2-polyprenyl-3-methyl-5-hydroxy-6-metoxy-1,4-benzoquinol methylase
VARVSFVPAKAAFGLANGGWADGGLADGDLTSVDLTNVGLTNVGLSNGERPDRLRCRRTRCRAAPAGLAERRLVAVSTWEFELPFSQSGQIGAIVGFCESLQPLSVLDVGVGMGVYGFLLRTNLEHLDLFDVSGTTASLRPRSAWKRRIDGIEGFATYLTPVHAYAYNQVIIADALDALSKMADGSYELVLAVDILEHFTKEQGDAFICECVRVCSRACLISTPKEFIHQVVEANPLEDHRSHWLKSDLEAHGFDHFLDDTISWVATQRKHA